MPEIQIQTAPGQPIQPVETTRTTLPTSSTTTPIAAPGQEAADAALVEQQRKEAEAQAAVTPALAAQKTAEADAADLNVSGASVAQQQVTDTIDRYKGAIKKAQDAAADAEAKYANFKFYDYFTSRPAADLTNAKVAAFFGGFGAGLLGQNQNTALENINRTVDRNMEQQKQELHSREHMAELKRQGVSDVYGALQHELAGLEIKHAAMYKALAAQGVAIQARAGVPLEQARQNVLVQQALVKAAEFNAEGRRRLQGQFTSKAMETSIEETAPKGQGAHTPAEEKKMAAAIQLANEHGNKLADMMATLKPEEIQQINQIRNLQQAAGEHKSLTAFLQNFKLDPQSGASPKVKEYVDRLHAYAEAATHAYSNRPATEQILNRYMDFALPGVSNTPEDLQRRSEELKKNIAIQTQAMAPAAPAAASGTAPTNVTPPPKTEVKPRGFVQKNRATGAIRIADGKGGWRAVQSGR